MTYVLTAILVMAIVTYLPRVLPLVLVQKNIKYRFIKSFLYYVPYAVLGAMTFPAILYSTGNMLSAVIGMAVAVVLAFFDKGLMKVAISSIAAVYIVELVIRQFFV